MKNSIEKETMANKDLCDRTLHVLPSFKDIRKETMGQTYCYLNKLLKNKSHVNFENLSDFLDFKKPLPLFEESLRLIVVDLLHLDNEVMEIFLNQNNYQIKRILRCQWFFINFLNSAQLKTQIFPHVSVSLRSKIINKLSKNLTNEENANELFEFVFKNYGLAQAEIFLPKCSDKFILKYFSTSNALISNHKCKILLLLSKRSPKLGITIFSLLCDKASEQFDCLNDYAKVLFYLARTNNEIFVPFFSKFYLKLLFLRFGNKLSKKIGLQVKEELFKSKELMKSSVFKKSILFKIFSFDDKVNFLTAVVIFEKDLLTFDNWKESMCTFSTFLKLVTPNQRMVMIEAIFKKVYDFKILDYSYLLSTQLLELIPLKIRYPYLKAYAKSISKDLLDYDINSQCTNFDSDLNSLISENFTYLLESDVAFKNLKVKLAKASSIEKRQELLELMVDNCAINKDIDQLIIVLDFIGNRMRNDDPKILMQILFKVFELFPQKTIKIELLQKIEEISRLCFLKNEGHLRCYESVMEKCILFKLNKNLDVSQLIMDLVDYKISTRSLWMEFIENFRCEDSRKFFLAFYNEVYRKMSNDLCNNCTDLTTQLIKWILDTLLKFNKFHKKNPILLEYCPELLKNLEGLFIKELKEFVVDDLEIKNFVKKRPDLLLKSNFDLIGFMIKQNPKIFVKKLEVLFKYLFLNFGRRECREFYILSLKLFSFAKLTDEIKKIIIKCFQNENSLVQKKNSLKMFSYICTKEEFEELIKEFIPNNVKINVDSNKEFSQIQLLVPQIIRNIIPSCKNLDLILKFFEGDFLKSAICSFSKFCYHTRIDQLIPNLIAYLIKISDDRRISLKKEVIRILITVSPRQNVIFTCLDIWEKIDHYSIRTIILKQISKIFVEEPTMELFHVLSKMIQESDEETIEGGPQLNQINESFLQPYVSALWVFSENKKPEFKKDFRNSIISFFTIPTVVLLSTTFCEEIITKNLFKAKGLNVVEFAVDYLLCQKEEVLKKLDVLMELLKNSIADLNKISHFLKTLRIKSLNHLEFCEDLFNSLCNNLVISTSNILFDDFVLLNYYRIHHSLIKMNNNERSLKFAENLIKFYSKFDDFDFLLTIFSDCLKIFFEELKKSQDFNKIAVLKEFLNFSNQNQGYVILIILAIPPTISRLFRCEEEIFDSTFDNFSDDLKFIFESLRTNSNKTVQIHFRRKFGFRKNEQIFNM